MWGIEIVGFGASAVTISMFASELKSIQEIKYKKSVGERSYLPFFTMIWNCIMWCCYGLFIFNRTIFLTNIVGVVFGIYYLLTFYSCTTFYQQDEIKIRCFTATRFFVIFLLYVSFSLPFDRGIFCLGLAANLLTILLFGSQLASLNKVKESKSTAALSLPLTVTSLACTFLWVVFGFMLGGDFWVIFPNGIGFILSSITLSLFFIYSP